MTSDKQRDVWRRRARAQYKRTNGLYQKRAHRKHYKAHPKLYVCMTGKNAAEFINSIKLQHGRCALHALYNNGQEYYCTPDTLRAFCWDHIDRNSKLATVSQMVGSATQQQLLDEIAKCWLLCANCHQLKSHDNKDYLPLKKVNAMKNELTLFDMA